MPDARAADFSVSVEIPTAISAPGPSRFTSRVGVASVATTYTGPVLRLSFLHIFPPFLGAPTDRAIVIFHR